jgi:hypothetical protein
MDKGTERISIVDIIDHNYAVGVFVEVSADHFVLFVSRKIKEVNRNWMILQSQLFNTIVNADGRDVPLYKTTFTVALYETRLSHFRVAN